MANDRTLRRRRELTAYIRKLKSRPCSDCNGSFPWVAMDFDHCRGEKLANIAQLARRGVSVERLEEELAKCDVVCKNCHAIRTWVRADYPDWL